MKSVVAFFLSFLVFDQSAYSQPYLVTKKRDHNGYVYEMVTNDPAGLRVYTLKNGLKVYLARNTEEPRIQYVMGLKAGSAYDPPEHTGLAHYLEHILFNGNDSIGSLDWKKEKPLIDKIEELFEVYGKEQNEERRKTIYKEIDSISFVASHYGIKNEYRKLASTLGAVAINGGTNLEQISYYALIPSGSLERFLKLESTRFRKMVPRSFSSELEIVYEEFNIEQANVFKQKFYAMGDLLYQRHPYGTQKVIGTSQHLKNPSIKAIYEYFDRYYAPNNMALILTGDIDFEHTIQLVDKMFGSMEKREIHLPVFPSEEPILEPKMKEIFSPDEESVYLGFRLNGAKSPDEKYLVLLNILLGNETAGLLETDLITTGFLKKATSSIIINNQFSVHYLDAYPAKGQSLDEAKEMLLKEIEKIKRGEFDEGLLKASINEFKRKKMLEWSDRSGLAFSIYDAFSRYEDWDQVLSFISQIESITKNSLVNFVRKNYVKNYGVVYKRTGELKTVKVKKPDLTPIQLNSNQASLFAKDLENIRLTPSRPVYVDFTKSIQYEKLSNGIQLVHVKNTKNNLFSVDILFDMDKSNSKEISLVVDFLQNAASFSETARNLKKEFYKNGLELSIFEQSNQYVFRLEGLEENLVKGIQLLDDYFSKLQIENSAYSQYIEKMISLREANRGQKRMIAWALRNYCKYGENSPLRDILSEAELSQITASHLTTLIKEIRSYKHRIFYYGSNLPKALGILNQYYKVQGPFKEYPQEKKFEIQKTKRQIYFADYNQAQADVYLLVRGQKFSLPMMIVSNMFNRFIEKLVTREVREARSLAYSTWAAHIMSSSVSGYNYFEWYAGTQANKLPELLTAMDSLMKTFPYAKSVFELAKEDQLKRYEAQRISGPSVFWTYEGYKKLGISHDISKDIYEAIKKMTFSDMQSFFLENIGQKDYALVIVGPKKDLDMTALSKYGDIKEMDIDYLFNYK